MKLCIMKQDILYIDPQSYGNLAAYDYNLLTNTQKDILYIHSQKYDYKAMNLPGKPWFKYNKLHSSLAKVLSYALTYAKIFCLIMCWRPRIIHVQWFKCQPSTTISINGQKGSFASDSSSLHITFSPTIPVNAIRVSTESYMPFAMPSSCTHLAPKRKYIKCSISAKTKYMS